MPAIYHVCIPNTHRDYFDYYASDCEPCIGARVWVPFRNQERLGIVVSVTADAKNDARLKFIRAVIDAQALISADMLVLCQWIGNYYQSPLSEVIPLALPKKYRLGQSTQLPLGDFYHLILPLETAKQSIPSQARRQHELIALLAQQTEPVSRQFLAQQGFNSNQIMRLLAANVIALSQQIMLPERADLPVSLPLPLNPEQAVAVTEIIGQLQQYHGFLLQGVTGSGKTEVYLQVIAEVLQRGRQVLVLVPEIGLTPQLLARFSARFEQPIAVIHSHLNESERQRAWQLAADAHVKIVIGTRAAVFTPIPNLGLIVIDEEHDSSLKQMEGVRYSARDTALMRAYLANIPVVLGSATPSLESMHNCLQQKYTLLRLNHKALSSTPLHYQIIDLRAQTLQHGLAAPALEIIADHLKQGNQVLIFINRRGFAPVLLCHQCGWMADCRACDSHMTLHRQSGQLICHHCGLQSRIPGQCLACQSKELLPVGAGTQRVYEFLSEQFPHTSMLRIDRDSVSKKHALDRNLEKISNGEVQLIVGTQMLAKGHHFPRLSLVVILDADAGLYNPDFRALEHLGQLLTQVSGRAGRAEQAGQVLIQTHLPDHPLLNCLIRQGYDAFATALLAEREQAALPPFHYLALIRAQGRDMSKVWQFLQATKDQIKIQPIHIMGPAPAPMPRKANQFRMQLLIKSSSRNTLKTSLTNLREWLTISKSGSGVRWNIDIDPVDLS